MNSTITLSAQSIGYSFSLDPELQLPEYPRFIPEILALPYGKFSVVFEGVSDTQVISGKSVRILLHRLVPLLDGSNTLPDLSDKLATVPAAFIRDVVTLFYSRGLLEDGAEHTLDADQSPISSFLGRYNDVTRVNRSREESLGRLEQAQVAVYSRSGASHLVSALANSHLRRVDVIENISALSGERYDVFLAVFTDEIPEAIAEIMSTAKELELRVLHVHIGGDKVEVGPLFIPQVSGCYDCMRSLHSTPISGNGHELAFWSGVIAQYAINLLSRVGKIKLYNQVQVYLRTDHGSVSQKYQLARLPGCKACGLEGSSPLANKADRNVWLLHNAPHVMTCKSLRSPKDHQIHYAAKNIAMTLKPEASRHGATTEIPLEGSLLKTSYPSWAGDIAHTKRIDLNLLSDLLRFAAGVSPNGEEARKICPSGGGLGSLKLYVIINDRSVTKPGIYLYRRGTHDLEFIDHVDRELLCGCLGITKDEICPITLVFSSDMKKLRDKYDEFSFRLAVLDTGVARGYIQDILDANGIVCREFTDVRDRTVVHILKLPTSGSQNVVNGAVGIGEPYIDGEPPSVSDHHYHSSDTLIDLCSRLGPSEQAPGFNKNNFLRVVPPALIPLGDLMLARRSVRKYAGKGISRETAEIMAKLSLDMASRRRQSCSLVFDLDLLALVTKPHKSLPTGIYRWNRAQGKLVALVIELSVTDAQAVMHQHGFSEAPLTFIVTGNMDRAISTYGARGYREIVGLASSILSRSLLVSANWGITSCLWGGMAEDGLGTLLGLDRYTSCPLFAASFGYQIEDADEQQ